MERNNGFRVTGPLRIGSLCTGYGGLDMAVQAVFGGHLSWCADNDRHVSNILAARYPDVPNLGDLTKLDWASVAKVEIICAGFPCQDISYSGLGAGIEKGDRSGIWKNIIQGVRLLRPKVIVVENVAAIRSRGLDRVLGDLAAVGYDSVWTSLRASDIGAAHRRERVFVLAYRPGGRNITAAAYARCQRRFRWSNDRAAQSWRTSGRSVRLGHLAVSAKVHSGSTQSSSVGSIAWGRYREAIARWAAITGRRAPYPTERGTRGQARLSPAFSEWLMGLPTGLVTGVGLPYTAQHRAIGNGVVPLQAVAALMQLTTMAAWPTMSPKPLLFNDIISWRELWAVTLAGNG